MKNSNDGWNSRFGDHAGRGTVAAHQATALIGGDHRAKFAASAQLVEHALNQPAHRAGHAGMKARVLQQQGRQQRGACAGQAGDEVVAGWGGCGHGQEGPGWHASI